MTSTTSTPPSRRSTAGSLNGGQMTPSASAQSMTSEEEHSLSKRLHELATEDDELQANSNDHDFSDSESDNTNGKPAATSTSNGTAAAPAASKSKKELERERVAREQETQILADGAKLQSLIDQFRQSTEADVQKWESESELARETQRDRVVIKFLTARQFNVAKAVEMWRQTVQWRHDMNVDHVLEIPYKEGIRVLQTLNNQCDHKFSRKGHPVYYERVGRLQPDVIFSNLTMDQMMSYQRHNTEFRRKVLMSIGSIRSNTSVDQMVSVIDLKGVGTKLMTKKVYSFLKNLSSVNQAYYPEFMSRMFIVNSPSAFSIAWKLIRPWLSDGVRAKISIHKGLPTQELLEVIDENSLPAIYGGKCNCTGGCVDNGSLLYKYYIGVCQLGVDGVAEKNELIRDVQKLNQLQNIPEVYDDVLKEMHDKYSAFMSKHF